MTVVESAAPAGQEPESAPRETASTQLFKLALESYDLGQSTDGEAFARPLGSSIVRPLRGRRDGLRAELSWRFAEKFGKVPGTSALTDAITGLEGAAQIATPVDLHLRIGDHEGRTVLDLGRTDEQVVVVDAERWTVTQDCPVLFRRTALTLPLPLPEPGGDLSELRSLLNVTQETWPLVLAWLVMAFFPGISHPILLPRGEQGCGKTTLAVILSRTIDPAVVPVRSVPRDLRNWQVAAAGSYVVAVDNVSAIQPWFSDALCRAATGEGIVDRALYSDFDVAVRSYRRCVALTSIDPGAMQGDFAERTMVIDLERLAPGTRRLEQELQDQFAAAHPHILGALLTLVSQVRAVLPEIQLDELPRMADAARIMAAVDRVLGTESLPTYLEFSTNLATEVLEGDPVADALQALLEARVVDGPWQTTAQEVLAGLNTYGPADRPKDWPKTAQQVSGWLTRSKPLLRVAGVAVESRKVRGRRVIVFDRTEGSGT